MEFGYRNLFNSTDINADSITTEKIVINDIEIDSNLSLPYLNSDSILQTDSNKNMIASNTINNNITLSNLTANKLLKLDNNKNIVNDNEDYLTTTVAASIYQTIAGMTNYLTTTVAAATYQTIAGMTNYLTTTVADATYQTIAGMTNYLTKHNPTYTGTMNTPLTVNSIVQTNASKQLITSLNLPPNSFATNMSLTTPTLSNPSYTGTMTTPLTASSLIQTNVNSQLIASNTLPSNLSATNMSLLNPSYTGTMTTPLTASSLIQTNASSQLTTSNTLPNSSSATNMSLTTPTITGTISGILQNNDLIISGNAIRCGLNGTTTTPSLTWVNYTGIGFSSSSSGLHCITNSTERLRISSVMTLYTNLIPNGNKTINLGGTGSAFNIGHFNLLQTNRLVVYDAPDIIVNNSIHPNTNNMLLLGTSSSYFNGGYFHNLYTNNLRTIDTSRIEIHNNIRPSNEKTLFLGSLGRAFSVGYFDTVAANKLATYDSGTIECKSSITPETNNLQDLGSTSKRFRHIYVTNILFGGQTTADLNMIVQGPNSVTAQARSAGWNTYSNLRMKENIKKIDNSLEIIEKINPVYFTWKKDYGDNIENHIPKQHIGFIAEEICNVLPYMCSFNENNEPNGVDYSKITPLLVASIQELLKYTKKLEQRLSILENI